MPTASHPPVINCSGSFVLVTSHVLGGCCWFPPETSSAILQVKQAHRTQPPHALFPDCLGEPLLNSLSFIYIFQKGRELDRVRRCGLVTPEQKVIVTSLNLLATLLFIELKMLLALVDARVCSWPALSCPQGPPGSSLLSCSPAHPSPACVFARGFAFPGTGFHIC